MSEKEKKILETFGKAIPGLSDLEKEKLLAFGEGMAFVASQRKGGSTVENTYIRFMEGA